MRQQEEAMIQHQTNHTTGPETAADALAAPFTALDGAARETIDGAARETIAATTGDHGAVDRAGAAVIKTGHSVIAAAQSGLRTVSDRAGVVVDRGPSILRSARSGIARTVVALQTLPDTTLRSLAATSVGLGAGLSFTRAGRLGAIAGVVPAFLMEAAIANRPGTPLDPEGGAK
jgi:hypothetical protein